MSKFTDDLRSLGVYNEHGFFNGRDCVWIGYQAGTSGRGGRSPVWQVYRLRDGQSIQTHPDGHWMNYGRKTFPVYGRGDRAMKLEEAKAWAGERFGITEWKRSPFGGWGDAAFVTARTKALRAALPSRETNAPKET